jgi:membrane protease YdiL (CAAX protease family)
VGFCLLHIISYVNYYPWDMLLICAIQYLPASICFAAAYRYSGNILSPIMIHAAINLIATVSTLNL